MCFAWSFSGQVLSALIVRFKGLLITRIVLLRHIKQIQMLPRSSVSGLVALIKWLGCLWSRSLSLVRLCQRLCFNKVLAFMQCRWHDGSLMSFYRPSFIDLHVFLLDCHPHLVNFLLTNLWQLVHLAENLAAFGYSCREIRAILQNEHLSAQLVSTYTCDLNSLFLNRLPFHCVFKFWLEQQWVVARDDVNDLVDLLLFLAINCNGLLSSPS